MKFENRPYRPKSEEGNRRNGREPTIRNREISARNQGNQMPEKKKEDKGKEERREEGK